MVVTPGHRVRAPYPGRAEPLPQPTATPGPPVSSTPPAAPDPGLDCTGGLTLVGSAPDKLVTEHIERQPTASCTLDGIITMTPNAGGLSFAHARQADPGHIAMTAELARV